MVLSMSMLLYTIHHPIQQPFSLHGNGAEEISTPSWKCQFKKLLAIRQLSAAHPSHLCGIYVNIKRVTVESAVF
jgi:hypothetical protein